MTYCSDFQRRSQISLTQFLERGVSQTSREVRLNIGDFPPPAISPSVSSPQTRQPSSSATHNETPAPLPSSGQKRPASMRPKLENTQVGPILRNSTVRSPPNQSELSSHSLSAQVDSTVSNEPLDPDDIGSISYLLSLSLLLQSLMNHLEFRFVLLFSLAVCCYLRYF